MAQKYVNNPNSFCYVCWDLTLKSHDKCLLTPLFRKQMHYILDARLEIRIKADLPRNVAVHLPGH